MMGRTCRQKLRNRFIPMPNLNNVSSPSLWQRIWQGFLTTVGTKQFFRIFAPWVKWLAILAGVCLLLGSVWGLAFAPPDYLQGNSYRIIFIHVPAASLAISIYFALAVLGVIYLVWKIKTASLVAQALAPMGFLLCVISLLTGSIWAKPTWGTYWVWDARLTSMLILAFLYAGVMALFAAFEHTANRGKAAAILSIVGAVNLPIIKYSVEWFYLNRCPKNVGRHVDAIITNDYWQLFIGRDIGNLSYQYLNLVA